MMNWMLADSLKLVLTQVHWIRSFQRWVCSCCNTKDLTALCCTKELCSLHIQSNGVDFVIDCCWKYCGWYFIPLRDSSACCWQSQWSRWFNCFTAVRHIRQNNSSTLRCVLMLYVGLLEKNARRRRWTLGHIVRLSTKSLLVVLLIIKYVYLSATRAHRRSKWNEWRSERNPPRIPFVRLFVPLFVCGISQKVVDGFQG